MLLTMENICKRFGNTLALDKVSLKLEEGSIHALMGENGAGKSTLMKCLFGVYRKDKGIVRLNEQEINFINPKQALENGVAMVHQELNQVLEQTVLENIWLGRYKNKFGIIKKKEMYGETLNIFKNLNIDVDPDVKIGTLSVSQRQMVEIAKAVSYHAKVIVMDEPTSSLNEREVEHLFKILNMLKDAGCGIIYISHKMAEILEISDTVTIMRDGKSVSSHRAEDLTTDKIINLMVGRELNERFPSKTNTPSDIILEVKNLNTKYKPRLTDINFSLRKGEILGIAGLVSSGRTEILEALFGIRKIESGTISVNGTVVVNNNPLQAKKNDFALLTEERRANGIFPSLSIEANTTISSLKDYNKTFYIDNSLIRQVTNETIQKLKIKTADSKAKIKTLSGGNQQKVILGRWLLTRPEILLLDEPTRGIDVGAKYEIYQIINELASNGKGIIVVSSEMAELLGICDRIMVMSNYKVAGILENNENTDQETIMKLASKFI
ncbi:MAG: sugar ABC transporter ATP-binding protein [Clostridia bacterium]|nr:sugar ABC transporter ATP-binding protein [Clostridia bacterium]